MLIRIDEKNFDANSRLVAIRLATLSLRLMEYWRREVGDYDKAMILISVAAISAEKLTRLQLDADARSLRQRIDRSKLTHCSVASIAAATGLNRETARRKINGLIEQGWLVRDSDGSIDYAPGFAQEQSTSALLRQQLETVRKAANDMMLYGAFTVDRSAQPSIDPPRATGRRRRVDGRGPRP